MCGINVLHHACQERGGRKVGKFLGIKGGSIHVTATVPLQLLARKTSLALSEINQFNW
jgi:hypothetical protein